MEKCECPSTNEWINVVNPDNGISFGNEKKCSIETWYNMDEPWTHCDMFERSQSQKATYDSIYMKYPQ